MSENTADKEGYSAVSGPLAEPEPCSCNFCGDGGQTMDNNRLATSITLFVQQQRSWVAISWKGIDSVTANEASDCAVLFIENIGYYI